MDSKKETDQKKDEVNTFTVPFDLKEFNKTIKSNQNQNPSFINTIWITCSPRVGGTWTKNVIKEIYKLKKYNTLPKYQSKQDPWSDQFKIALEDNSKENVYIFHTHEDPGLNLPRSKYILNIRNPYDICASFYEFMKCDLGPAIETAKNHLNDVNHFKKIHPDNLLINKYEDIENKPIDMIKDFCKFLNLKINLEDIQAIESKFSRKNVRSNIIDLENSIKNDLKMGKQINPENLVIISPSNIRCFDTQTAFQSGHISNRKTGEWKTIFSESQIKSIIEHLDESCVLLGYQSEK